VAVEIKWHPTVRELRQFGALYLPAAALVFGVGLVRAGSWRAAAVIGVAAAVVALTAIARPKAIRPLFVGAMVAAYPIGWVVSHLILAVIFYGVFTIAGLAMRIFGYDPLQRKRDGAAGSYWTPVPQRRDPQSYFRQS
jgi:hypothetical protein